jgi:hypothetical protein
MDKPPTSLLLSIKKLEIELGFDKYCDLDEDGCLNCGS